MKCYTKLIFFYSFLVWSIGFGFSLNNVKYARRDSSQNINHLNGLDELAIRIQGGPLVADQLAKKYGYINFGKVMFILFNT